VIASSALADAPAFAASNDPLTVQSANADPGPGFPDDWTSLMGRAQDLPAGSWTHVQWSTLPGMRIAAVRVLDGTDNGDGSCTPREPATPLPQQPYDVVSREVAVNPDTCASVWQISEPFMSTKTTSTTSTTSVTYVSGYRSKDKFDTTGWYEYTTYQCTHSSTLTSTSPNKVYVNVGNAIYANSTFCRTGTTYVQYNNVRIAGNPTGTFTASHSAIPTIWGGCSSAVFRVHDTEWGNETL
jgi:hypothetical protein